ncbi:MAG: DJ-1/PfpI family protein [Gammaproteobacteria bacterium]|nr:DJ-1/PfpI family protein [Gammaproteobacteria bacterium]
MPRVLVPLAEGFEELEAVTIIDLLRRGGIEVDVAGLQAGNVRGSRQTMIAPDLSLDEAGGRDYDMVVLPGGLPGATNLDEDPRIHQILHSLHDRGRYTAAICAAPLVLAKAGLLSGRRATGFPGTLEATGAPDIEITGGSVERDGTVITSRGPGTAMDFALTLIETLTNRGNRDQVEATLQRDPAGPAATA